MSFFQPKFVRLVHQSPLFLILGYLDLMDDFVALLEVLLVGQAQSISAIVTVTLFKLPT